MKFPVFFIVPLLLLRALVCCSLESAVPSLQKIAIITAVQWESEGGQSPSADFTLLATSKAYNWHCFQHLIDGVLKGQGIRFSAGRLEIVGLSALKIRVLAFVPDLIRELSMKDCSLTREMSTLFVQCLSSKLGNVEKLELIKTTFAGITPQFPALKRLYLDGSLLFASNLGELYLKNISHEQFVYDLLVENHEQLLALKLEDCTLDFPKEKNAFGWLVKDPAPKDHLYNHLFNMKRLQQLEIQRTKTSIYRKEDLLSRPYPKSLQGLKVSSIEGFGFTRLFLQKTLSRASNLTSLSIDRDLFHEMPQLSFFAQFPTVKSLCLKNFPFSQLNFGQLSGLLEHLEELIFFNCSTFNLKKIFDIGHTFPEWALQRFIIQGERLQIDDILELAFKVFQLCEYKLTHLTMPMSPARDLNLTRWRFTQMLELDLYFPSRLAYDRCFEAHWDFRRSFPKLQKLTLRGYVMLDKIADLESVPSLDISQASNFDDLKVLEFLGDDRYMIRELTVASLNIEILEAFLDHPTINTLWFRLDETNCHYRRMPGRKKLRQVFDQ